VITKDDVIKIAKLAKLQLSEAEITKYQKDLSAILDYAEQLNELNTNNVKPLYQVTELEHVVRDDIVVQENADLLQKLVSASPHGVSDNQFVVKNVL